MKIIVFVLLTIYCFESYGQGRKIDIGISVLKPQEFDTIVSRKNGTYEALYILKNYGPDTIKPHDNYRIYPTFGNIVYNSISRFFNKTIFPQGEDTVSVVLQMTWDTNNNHTDLCGTVYIYGESIDSIKKESKAELVNNKFCQKVAHKSKLSVNSIIKPEVKIYPNPANENITIELPDITSKYTIKTISTDGKIIESFEIEKSIKINTSNYKPGLYLIQIFNKNESEIYKINILK